MTNTGRQPWTGWRLDFVYEAAERITQSWNGIAEQSGPSVSVRNAAWNGRLEPGRSVELGFLGTGSSAPHEPTSFRVNGADCG